MSGNTKTKNYFIIYQSRHHGWIGKIIDSTKAEEILGDEDNMDIYVCYSNSPVTWKGLLSLSESPFIKYDECFKPWEEHELDIEFLKGEINILKCTSI